MFLFQTVLLLLFLPYVFSNHFSFDAATYLSSAENWLHEEIPCIGDRIRFDSSAPLVVFMDHNVNVESIQLPDNGILVFTDNGFDTDGVAEWQCSKDALEEPKEAFYSRDSRHDTSFYNPSNWIPEKRKYLHMNQVPSEQDDVTVSSLSSAQIYLDLPVKVNTFRYYKRERMTTDDFNALLRTMEGQFQFILTRPWAHENDEGGVQRLLADDAITVRNDNKPEDPAGTVNSNSNPKILSTICSYLQCEGDHEQCIESFVPFGHCCPVCGTRINFYAMGLDMKKAKKQLYHVLSDLEKMATVFATFEMTKKDQLGSEYEIAIINSHNSTFDEDFHKLAETEILKKLLSITAKKVPVVGTVKLHSSRIDRTIKTSSKILASVIYFSILIVLVGMYIYQNLELRLQRQNLFNPVIKYQRQTDDVAIEMGGVLEEESSEVDDSEPENHSQESEDVPQIPERDEEDVEDWKNINPNFDLASSVENPTTFEMTETIRKPASEEYVAMESSLVEQESIKEPEENSEAEAEGVANILDINPNFEEDSESGTTQASEIPELEVIQESSSEATLKVKEDDDQDKEEGGDVKDEDVEQLEENEEEEEKPTELLDL